MSNHKAILELQMTTSARIQICADDHTATKIAEILGFQDYAISTAHDADVALVQLKTQSCDLAFFALTDIEKQKQLIEAIPSIRRGSVFGDTPMPVICIAADDDQYANEHPLLEYVNHDFAPQELMTKVGSLARLATVQSELIRRIKTSKTCRLTPANKVEPLNDVSDASILLVPGNGDEALELSSILSDVAGVTIAEDSFVAVTMLEEKSYDTVVVVLESGVSANDILWMCTSVRANPKLFNLPIIMIADDSSFETPNEPFMNGVTEVVSRPIEKEQLCRLTGWLLRRELYRRDLLTACRHSNQKQSRDETTGLYRSDFMDNHLQQLFGYALENRKHLSLASITMLALTPKQTEQAKSKFLRHMGHLVSRLIRGEDTAARFSEYTIIVAMPDTPIKSAQFVLRRILAIINNTEFELASDKSSLNFTLQAGLAEVSLEDSLESFVARAQSDLFV